MSYDLVIRGGTVVDGSGAPSIRADVAVAGGQIAEVAPSITEGAKRSIDAGGMTVTPGFIDPHTHFDGQATWDNRLGPAFGHGVTTAVMGCTPWHEHSEKLRNEAGELSGQLSSVRQCS